MEGVDKKINADILEPVELEELAKFEQTPPINHHKVLGIGPRRSGQRNNLVKPGVTKILS